MTCSLWMDEKLPSFPRLETNMKTDVCVIGAGIAGLTVAYTLLKAGKSVIILDQGPIASGQTSRTTAHLSWVLNDRYFELEKYFGNDGAHFAAKSHAAAIDYIEKIILEENINCDFERVDGYLFTSPKDIENTLEKELLCIRKLNMPVSRLEKSPAIDKGPCLHFPNQGQFHVVKYLKGVLDAIINKGGLIFTHTHVNQIEEGLVKTSLNTKVQCDSIVVATCSPINNRLIIHTKQAPYRTYVIAASIKKGAVPKGLYWDTEDPYHYIRLQKHINPELDWIIIGGEDHKTGQDQAVGFRYAHLETWARHRIPEMSTIEYRWSGQVFNAQDSLGFIGKNPLDKNIYIATGDSGNGMTHGTIAGILIPDLILGKENPWHQLYEPSRKTFSTASTFLSENINTFLQYEDWLTPGEKEKIVQLKPEEGTVIREGFKKLAVYKDKESKIHINSAFCPHLGGCVRWNSGEKSWDCPCHGSRFDGCGNVITGPAMDGLTKNTQSIKED